MAMLSVGTAILFAVVGAALFGGFDPRKKKKKNGEGSAEPSPDPVPPDTLIDCAAIVDRTADGSRVSVDGGPSVPVGTFFQNIEDDVLQLRAPVVMLTVCEPDPLFLDVMEELCAARPEIIFLASYAYRLEPGELRDQVMAMCTSERLVASAQVVTSPEEGILRVYPSEMVAELQLREGDDIAQFVANMIAFVDGAPHESMVESA